MQDFSCYFIENKNHPFLFTDNITLIFNCKKVTERLSLSDLLILICILLHIYITYCSSQHTNGRVTIPHTVVIKTPPSA